MNELLVDTVCQDSYEDALTLGPEPGVMEGADITIEAADVLMQFAVGKVGDYYWHDREYKMRPGTRSVSNVCGVRFRNKIPGSQALVNASLFGPSLPRLGPITPIAGSGVGDPILLQTGVVAGAGPVDLGTFDVGDWRALLLGIRNHGTVGGARLMAGYTPGSPILAANGYLDIRTSANEGLLLLENLAQEVTILLYGSGAPTVDIYAAPCGLDRQPWLNFVGSPILLSQTGNLGAGAPVNFLIQPFLGKGQLTFASGGSTSWTVTLQPLDYTGAFQQPIAIETDADFSVEVPLVPQPMWVTITNTGSVAGTYDVSLVIKEPA